VRVFYHLALLPACAPATAALVVPSGGRWLTPLFAAGRFSHTELLDIWLRGSTGEVLAKNQRSSVQTRPTSRGPCRIAALAAPAIFAQRWSLILRAFGPTLLPQCPLGPNRRNLLERQRTELPLNSAQLGADGKHRPRRDLLFIMAGDYNSHEGALEACVTCIADISTAATPQDRLNPQELR